MGLLTRLFGGKRKLEPADLSVLVADMHSHFIPGIDDGSPDMETSIELIRRMAEFGYKKVTTTPHVMWDYYKNTSEIILSGRDNVRAELKRQNIDIEFDAAAEYFIDENFWQLIENNDLLTIGDNYVLFEQAFVTEASNLNAVIFELQTRGYKPIIAHPERYPFWFNDYEKFVDLENRGVALQLNINSISGHYGPQTQKISERLIDDGLVSFLGTDAHHHNHLSLTDDVRRYPHLHKLLESGKLLNHTL